jgi:hypothetical protein
MQHRIGFYNDEPGKRVEFCKVCGVEYPVGECPGKYVKPKKTVNNDKGIDSDTERN